MSNHEEMCPVCGYPEFDPRCEHWEQPMSKSDAGRGELADEIERRMKDESSLQDFSVFLAGHAAEIISSLRSTPSREEIVEECAKVCDGEALRASLCIGQLHGAEMARDTAYALAASIRSLKGSK